MKRLLSTSAAVAAMIAFSAPAFAGELTTSDGSASFGGGTDVNMGTEATVKDVNPQTGAAQNSLDREKIDQVSELPFGSKTAHMPDYDRDSHQGSYESAVDDPMKPDNN